MNFSWPSFATLVAVALVWVGIWYLRKRHLQSTLLQLTALVVGIPIGLIARSHVQTLNPLGQIYINILLATVAPLILVAIISAITSLGGVDKLRSIGVRSVLWLLASNALAVVLALGIGLAFAPGLGLHDKLGGVSTDAVQGQVQSFSQVFVGFFPTNLVQNLSDNDIIPIILVAVVLSVAYLTLVEKSPEKVRPFRSGIEALRLVIFKVVGYVIRLTPYAIVPLTAYMVGSSTDLGKEFVSLIGLLALVWAACALHAYPINGVLLKVFGQVPVVPFFRKILPAQLTAFTTQSSIGTIPVTTTRLTNEVGVSSEIAHFTAPLGSTFGMPGCAGIWPMLIALWGINAFGVHYTATNYIVLALLSVIVSIGTAGVPGAATVAAATVLTAAKLPLEFVAVTIPISMLADMARTATNVTAAAVSATLVARETGSLDDEIFAGRAEFVEEDEARESAAPAGAAPEVRPAPVPAPQPAPIPVPAAVASVPAPTLAPASAFSVAVAGAEQASQRPVVATAADAAQLELAPPGWGAKVTLTVTATPLAESEIPPAARSIEPLAPRTDANVNGGTRIAAGAR